MPILSTLPQAQCVLELHYKLPEQDQLKRDFGEKEGKPDYSAFSEATLQMVFFGEYKLGVPDDLIDDPIILQSGAYAALQKNFYELIKNSIDAQAHTFHLTFFKNQNDDVEIVVSDDQAGAGFRSGKYARHFTSDGCVVRFQNLVQNERRLKSSKKRGKSLGGAGKGLLFLNTNLEEAGGFLALQSTPEYPAVLRLRSPPVRREGKLMEEKQELCASAADDFMSLQVLNKIQQNSEKKNESHSDLTKSASRSGERGSCGGYLGSRSRKGRGACSNFCFSLGLGSLFFSADSSTRNEEDSALTQASRLGSPSSNKT